MNNTNPFLSTSTPSTNTNTFLSFNSNNQNTITPNPFLTNTNNLNPFNSNINNNNISNNSNDIFTRLKTSIISNNNSTFNNNNNLSYNPFANNNNNSSIFNNNNNMSTNNNSFISNNNFFNNNQNFCTYYYGGMSYNLPKCTTFGKLPNTTFDNNIKLFKQYDEKVKIGKLEYSSGRTENLILCDQNFKDFSIEEVRANDYIKSKISFFDGWNDKNNTNISFLGNNNNISMNNNSFFNNGNNNPFLQNGNSNNIFNNNNSQINGGILNNNNISGSTNIFKSFINNNQNNNNSFTGNLFNNNNNSINPFKSNNNNNNNNNPFNINNNSNIFSTNNPFSQINNNNSINLFNNTNNNNNNNNNLFNNLNNNNNNNNQFTFGTNSLLGNNNTSNLLNNNNNNNNIFINNNSNFSFSKNNNNANIFNTATKNPFESLLNNNNNNNNNNAYGNNNNSIVNNILNSNQNIFYEKPFEEKIKDPSWLLRNVRIIDVEDPEISDDIDEIDKINLKVKEMLYFEGKKEENNINKNQLKELTFNKIIMPSDEEIHNFYKNKIEKADSKIEILKDNNNNDINNDSDNDKFKDNDNNDNENLYKRWEPIAILSNNDKIKRDKIYNLKNRKMNINNNSKEKYDISLNMNRFDDLKNNDTFKRNENGSNLNDFNKKEKISGFAEAAMILSNYDNNYVDFNSNNEQKEYILPTEREDFFKFNNLINNKQSYLSSSININKNANDNNNQINNIDNNNEFSNIINNNENNQINRYDNKFELNNNQKGINNYNNDNNSYESYSLNSNKNKNEIDIDIQMNSISSGNNMLNKNNNIEIEDFKNNKFNYDNNNNNYNFEASSTEYITANKNTVFTQKKEINNNINKENIIDNECKLIYFGDCNSIQELKSPITIPILSLIPNNNTDSVNSDQDILINLDLLIDIIKKNIISINDIENKIILPSDEDIYLLINGKIYSKITQTNIKLNDIEKKCDENNNFYYIIRYGFNLKQFPLLLENKDENLNYVTKPSIKDLLNPNNGYDLEKIENFEIYNKYGKIIFVDPIDLSGKIVINDIIKIKEGEIDLGDPRVDKLKAKVFLNFDFGDKLEGQYLENIKIFLKHKNSNFVKYENKVLEYNVNF